METLPPPPASDEPPPVSPPERAPDGDASEPAAPPPGRNLPSRGLWVALAVLAALFLTVVFAAQTRLPFYALSPGPVEEVDDITAITGTPVYDLNGDLYMLTVTVQEVNPFEFAHGWLSPNVDVYRREAIRPPDVTPEEHREINRQLMRDSRDVAVAVALRHLGYEVGQTGDGMLVVEVLEGTPASQFLQPGDVITAVDGEPVTGWAEGVEVIRAKRPGQEAEFTLRRGSEERTVRLTLAEHDSQPGRPMAGFTPATSNPSLQLPFPVVIDTANTGGPSAGIMYVLAIVDLLTEEDLLKGNIVAGTGAIELDGTVGAIGGVRQKVAAAQDAGARFILVPEDNYADALSAQKEGVEVFAIASLEEALAVLESLPSA